MSGAKHTPGPWRVQQETESSFGSRDKQVHWRIYSDAKLGRSPFVCQVPHHSCGPKEADARLIAAAPTMLDALETVVASLSERPLLEAPYHEQAVSYALTVARQALASARGEESDRG